MLTKEYIEFKLTTSTKWLEHGILAIYSKQTADEKRANATLRSDGCGFNAYDVETLSIYAKQLLKGNHLDPVQRGKARHKMLKYSGQLLKIAQEKKQQTI
jgi:hypothetical protein